MCSTVLLLHIYFNSIFSFGLTPAETLNVPSVVANQSVDVSLPLATTGLVQRMDPLTNLQVCTVNVIVKIYQTGKSVSIFPTHIDKISSISGGNQEQH